MLCNWVMAAEGATEEIKLNIHNEFPPVGFNADALFQWNMCVH